MAWKLFLDDDADTVRAPWISIEADDWRIQANLPLARPVGHRVSDSWILARSYEEAVRLIGEFGFPSFVSFDHDLVGAKTGKDLANYLVDLDIDTGTMPADFSWEVHSANRVGRLNIDAYLSNYLRHRQRRN